MAKKYSLHKIDDKQYQLTINNTLECGMIFNDYDVARWTVDLLNEQSEKIEDLEYKLDKLTSDFVFLKYRKKYSKSMELQL